MPRHLRRLQGSPRQRFPQAHNVPDGGTFASSPALDLTGDLRVQLAADYEAECALLFYGPCSSFDEVLQRLASLASRL